MGNVFHLFHMLSMTLVEEKKSINHFIANKFDSAGRFDYHIPNPIRGITTPIPNTAGVQLEDASSVWAPVNCGVSEKVLLFFLWQNSLFFFFT